MIKQAMIGAIATAMLSPLAAFAEKIQYSEGVVQQALADGRTVFVDYTTEWCSTCNAQKDVINAALKENPAYDENILFVTVDWDEFSRAPISVDYNIPRRSTLIVLKGDEELGRNVASARAADVKALLDIALEAASTS